MRKKLAHVTAASVSVVVRGNTAGVDSEIHDTSFVYLYAVLLCRTKAEMIWEMYLHFTGYTDLHLIEMEFKLM